MTKRKILSAAIAVGMMAAGTAQAMTVGQPGTGLLVPYVLYDPDAALVTNTLVQITVGSSNVEFQAAAGGVSGSAATFSNFAAVGDADPTAVNGGTVLPIGQVARAGSLANLHWYFFDARSVHQLDAAVTVSANDVFPFDFGGTIQSFGQVAVDLVKGKPGYLVFGSNQARSGLYSETILWGDAILVNGNWQSAAYIPVLPLNDIPDGATFFAAGANCTTTAIDANAAINGCDEITYNGSFPTSVNPFFAGMTIGDGDGAGERLTWDMPYFVPATGGAGGTIPGETLYVIWADQNYDAGSSATGRYAGCTRASWNGIGVEVYSTDETNLSAVVNLPNELNFIDVATAVPGARTGTADADGVLDAGFVWFNAPEATRTNAGTGCAVTGLLDDFHGGVAFSLVDLLGGTSGQTQTEIAHERGLRVAPAAP